MSHEGTLKEAEVPSAADGSVGDSEDVGEGGASSGVGQAQARRETSPYGVQWAWATEQGYPGWAATEQLVFWLARGELPPHTLVWRRGWRQWRPALRVAELAAAFPRAARRRRRRARAVPESAAARPDVSAAHAPRLELLIEDPPSESPAPAEAAPAQQLTPPEAEHGTPGDLESVPRDLLTSPAPAAATIEAEPALPGQGDPVMPSRAERGRQRELENFGEMAPAAATPPPPALAPRALAALELGGPASHEPASARKPLPPSLGYGRWLSFGALAGAALALFDLNARQAAAPTVVTALQPAVPHQPVVTPAAPPSASDDGPRLLSALQQARPAAGAGATKTVGMVQPKRKGTPALLRALRVGEGDGYDRVVFEFRERVPNYELAYVDEPVRDCAAGEVRRIAGESRLEVRFSPASAHTERGEPTVRAREFKPDLSIVREVERTCDLEGVVTWVIGAASTRRYRAIELSAPPRLVVKLDHSAPGR